MLVGFSCASPLYVVLGRCSSSITRHTPVPSSSPVRGNPGTDQAPRCPVVPSSPEGKGPAPGPAAAPVAASAAVPGDVVSALTGLGRSPIEFAMANPSLLFSRLG